jgi:hypothetical protein
MMKAKAALQPFFVPMVNATPQSRSFARLFLKSAPK